VLRADAGRSSIQRLDVGTRSSIWWVVATTGGDGDALTLTYTTTATRGDGFVKWGLEIFFYSEEMAISIVLCHHRPWPVPA
jgi:hypothetical protein